MDALLITLLVCLLGEMGDRCQLLTLAFSIRFARPLAVMAGILVAAFANAALSALAGGFLAPMLGDAARLLFMASALVFTGVGLLMPVKAPDPLAGWRIGPFLTSALGYFILAFGNGAQFITLAVAVRTADPVMSAIGGGLGVSLSALPVVLLREQFFAAVPLRGIRIAGGVLLILIGLILALGALGLL
jgi:putative Ca2+/H+ antiporter (TMEM165/GDT1 family)